VANSPDLQSSEGCLLILQYQEPTPLWLIIAGGVGYLFHCTLALFSWLELPPILTTNFPGSQS
jgi:hypothetical protein